MKDQLKELLLPDTKRGRVTRTFLQAFTGLLSAFVVVLTIPGVQTWFASLDLIVQLGGVAAVIAGIAALQNYLEELLRK